jgi:hypothetical protein
MQALGLLVALTLRNPTAGQKAVEAGCVDTVVDVMKAVDTNPKTAAAAQWVQRQVGCSFLKTPIVMCVCMCCCCCCWCWCCVVLCCCCCCVVLWCCFLFFFFFFLEQAQCGRNRYCLASESRLVEVPLFGITSECSCRQCRRSLPALAWHVSTGYADVISKWIVTPTAGWLCRRA